MSKLMGKANKFKTAVREQRPLGNKFSEIIRAGMAAPAPPLGPTLGKYGINISNFCKEFNERTKDFIKGLPLPCIVTVKPDRSFNIAIKAPEASYFLKQAAGVQTCMRIKGEITGKVTLKHIYEIAKIKHEDPYSYLQLQDLKEVCKMLIGTARTCGIEVVRDLDPDEYQIFLNERQERLEKRMKELEELKLSKLMRS